MIDEFLAQYPRTAFANSSPKLDFPQLKEYIVKYQDPHQADSIMKIQKELDETKIVLHKTIESVLERGEKIDTLVEKSDGLNAQSKMFYKQVCFLPPQYSRSWEKSLVPNVNTCNSSRPRSRIRVVLSCNFQSQGIIIIGVMVWRKTVDISVILSMTMQFDSYIAFRPRVFCCSNVFVEGYYLLCIFMNLS